MTGTVWLDGAILDATEAKVSVFDHGLTVGDGVFETLRARSGRPTELAEHAARMERSAAGLSIAVPADLERRLAVAIADLLAVEGLAGPSGDASVRITL